MWRNETSEEMGECYYQDRDLRRVKGSVKEEGI